jgi:Polyketide cyclase / dehydrase and lipid transport
MVSEQIFIGTAPTAVYEAVSDIKRMARWSPECFAVWTYAGGKRFVGWNRRWSRQRRDHEAGRGRGRIFAETLQLAWPFVWFTTCRVTTDDQPREYAFDVTTFGMPVSRWGYRFECERDGTLVTEYWIDRRSRGAFILGRIFTGKVVHDRPTANREGMRQTLARLKAELESPQ